MALSDRDRLDLLKEAGVSVHHEQVWVGEVGTPERRSEPVLDSVYSVSLPLTAEEWCRMCMREGDLYVGGCCGTTSAMQDQMNAAFRDSGALDASELLHLATLARSHDGFDTFKDLDDSSYRDYLSRFQTLDPWDKVGLIFQGTTAYLRPKSYQLPLRRKQSDEERAFNALERGLAQLSWSDVFSFGDDETRARQRHAQRIVLLARILGPARTVAEALAAELEEFLGFALVDKDSEEVLANGYGLCLYQTREEAQEVLDLWTKMDAEDDEDEDEDEDELDADSLPKLSERAVIRPVRITVQDGVELG